MPSSILQLLILAGLRYLAKYFKSKGMKKWLLALSVFSITFSAHAQVDSASMVVRFDTTSPQIDTSVVVYSWKLDESLANRIRTEVDTALENYQRYNPAFRQFTCVQTLGNIGLPASSAVFTERPENQEFVLINSFYPFMKSFRNTQYINSRKPFTKLFYIKGGSNQTKEEMLDVFHSQNLTKTLNFGLHYTTLGSLGQYNLQKVKNNSFNFFSSLSGKLYSYHVSFNYNKILADENGGVLNDSLITDSTFVRTKDIPTLFGGTESSISHTPDVLNEIKNLNILAVQEISFRPKPKNTDSTSSSPRKVNIFYPKLVYIFSIDRTLRRFTDKNPSVGLNSGLYSDAIVSNELTSDSMAYWKVSNSARLQFQGRKNNHYFVDYSYELMKYSMFSRSRVELNDTLGKFHFITQEFELPGLEYRSNLYNSYVSTGFSKVFAKRLDVNLYGQYFISGYHARDFLSSADLKLDIGKAGKPVILFVKWVNKLKSPDFFYNHYASNNFIWTKNFDRTSTSHLSTKLAISSKKFAIQGDYYLLSNLIYLNEKAMPAQYGNALSIIVLSVAKQVSFWKITSSGKLVYQKSENENVVDLPNIAFNNSTYLSHRFNFKSTGGKLYTMIGFDLFYNTRYYADAYMPALNSFHRQHLKQLGNYPYFDAFLNLQLKRFKFFLKVEHVNAGWMNKDNYFSVLHYPRNGRDLKFGLSWTFYD